tara:strand:- start:1819 stop:2016 length:198 start_codon:yes stop_codon:yes gene_type:complete
VNIKVSELKAMNTLEMRVITYYRDSKPHRGAGGHLRARDYFRFGLGLNILALAVTLIMVPRLWPA